MNISYKKILTGTLIACSMIGISSVFAEDPDAFLLQVTPSTFGVNEAVDVSITAVKNGQTIKTYVGDVFIEVDGIANPDDYVVPSDGLWTFLLQDQWVKTYSKGLIIKKTGTYTLKVSDIINENIKWETTIIIWNGSAEWENKSIAVVSPVNGATETREIINVMWSSRELPNSTVSAYLNWLKVAWWLTTSNGDFSLYLSWVQAWENKLQIKIENIQWVVLGQSNIITFNYQAWWDWVFKTIEVSPSSNLKQWDKVDITVKTADDVTSASLTTSDGKAYPLDRIGAWTFTKQIMLLSDGTIYISLSILSAGNQKSYDRVASLNVEENTTVTNIKFFPDSVDGKTVSVQWDSVWLAAKYRIRYGTWADTLDQSVDVSTSEVQLQNLTIGTTYYFQITPLDANSIPTGTPSETVDYKIGSEVKCVVKWIIVNQEQIGNKYYLSWSPVENAEKYLIFKSDFETTQSSQMEQVWESTWTQFEYPFNPNTVNNEYAYYLVQAVCTDGTTVNVDTAKRVQVWPKENMILILLVTLLGYVIYKLYISWTVKQEGEK